jgi:hypothetical protein
MSTYSIWESHFPAEAAREGRRVTERIWADMRGYAGYLGHELLQDLDDPGHILVVSRWSSRRSGLDDDPAAALQLCCQLFGWHAAQHLLGCRHPGVWRPSCGGLARRLGLLELGDERRRFVARELAGRLALREPHRPAGVAKVGVSGVLEQREQLLHLAPRRRRPCLLSECHVPSLPARPRTVGDGLSPSPSAR